MHGFFFSSFSYNALNIYIRSPSQRAGNRFLEGLFIIVEAQEGTSFLNITIIYFRVLKVT